MIQLANYEERTFYVVLGQIVTTCDVKFIFQMTEEEFDVTLTPVSSTERATKFAFTATGYPEGQYIVQFNVSGSTLATVAGFVTGNPIFATSQYNTYNDDGTSTTYVPSDDQGLVPSVSQKLRVSTVDLNTDVSYVRYLKVTNGTLTDNGDNSVTINTSGVDTLEALTDVYIEDVENNQIIQYQGFSIPGSPAGWKNRVLQLASLSDTKGIPTEGKFLKYTGGFWQPEDGNASSLNDLSDVTITTPITGNVLKYDSSLGWYNTNLPAPTPPLSTTDQLPEGATNLYYTDARVSASAAVVLNTAKRSYPLVDETKLASIATGATANQTDAYLLSRTNHTGTQTAATISDFDTEVSNNTSVVANTAKRSYPLADETKLAGIATGATANSPDATLLNRANHTGTQTASTISDFSTAVDTRIALAREQYEVDEFITDRNITMGSAVSQSSKLVCDVINDSVASRNNANAKNMLGWHLGSGVCVLQGMIDLQASLTASPGQPLWLGASGTLSNTAPTTATEYSRILGYYVGTGQGGEVMVYFNPSPDWVQID